MIVILLVKQYNVNEGVFTDRIRVGDNTVASVRPTVCFYY